MIVCYRMLVVTSILLRFHWMSSTIHHGHIFRQDVLIIILVPYSIGTRRSLSNYTLEPILQAVAHRGHLLHALINITYNRSRYAVSMWYCLCISSHFYDVLLSDILSEWGNRIISIVHRPIRFAFPAYHKPLACLCLSFCFVISQIN